MMPAALEMLAKPELQPGSDSGSRSARSGGFSEELDAQLGGSAAEGRGQRAEESARQDEADGAARDDAAQVTEAETNADAQSARAPQSAQSSEPDAEGERATAQARPDAEADGVTRAGSLARALRELAGRGQPGAGDARGSDEASRDAQTAAANAARKGGESGAAQDPQAAQGRSAAAVSAEASAGTRDAAGTERAFAAPPPGRTTGTLESDPTSAGTRAPDARSETRSESDADAHGEDADRSGVREELRREALGLDRPAPARELREGSAAAPQDFVATLARSAGATAPGAESSTSGPDSAPAPLEAATPASPTPAGAGAGAPGAPPVASSIGELPFHMQTLATRGGGTARLQLNPPHLGELHVTVRLRGSQVDVQVIAREPAAQALVNAGREGLSEALATRDLRMDNFEVTLARDADAGGPGSDDTPTGGWEREPEREAGGFAPAPRRSGFAPDLVARAATPRPEASSRSSVDLRI